VGLNIFGFSKFPNVTRSRIVMAMLFELSETVSEILDSDAGSLLLSGYKVSEDLEELQNFGVTHIVNARGGSENHFPEDIEYFKVDVEDLPSVKIIDYFDPVCDFIAESINKGNNETSSNKIKNVVLVHCRAGISRSTTLIIAYLMREEQMSMQAALEFVLQH